MSLLKIIITTAGISAYSIGMVAVHKNNVMTEGFKNQNTKDTIKPNQTIIDLAGHKVPVVKGGLYERFRSNPPLSVIEKEAPEIDLSWLSWSVWLSYIFSSEIS